MSCLLAAVATTFVCVASAHAQSDDASGEAGRFGDGTLVIERDVQMVAITAPVYRSHVDLGEIPEGKAVRVRLNVFNPEDVAFRVKGTESSCQCANIVAGEGIVPSKGTSVVTRTTTSDRLKADADPRRSFTITLDFEPPPPGTMLHEGFRISDTEIPPARLDIVCRYVLAGALGFHGTTLFAEVPESHTQSEVAVPFTITKPLEVEELHIDCSESLASVDWRIELREGIPFVVGMLGENEIEKLPFSGFLRLQSLQMPKTASVRCLFKGVDDISVSPRFGTLRPTEDGTVFKGTAMVRLLDAERDATRDREAIVRCSVKGKPIQVESKYLGKGIFRVTYAVSRADLIKLLRANQDGSASSQKKQVGKLQLDWLIETVDGPRANETFFAVSEADLVED